MVRWASAISRNHLRSALLNGGRGSTVRSTVHPSRWLWTHRRGGNHPSDDRQLLHANLLSSCLNRHTTGDPASGVAATQNFLVLVNYKIQYCLACQWQFHKLNRVDECTPFFHKLEQDVSQDGFPFFRMYKQPIIIQRSRS
ncbi:hypothetical protein F9C07_1943 [Aspergillus flavus]|uniref:Uncharacterized protein n=1 Tax=Aspergillus flavus (strain ATCC 200026 / FGSC A1120 / IAM 13836 / NRRL 3357 / JCM 12722 / SRRC 167) TaxID=332952 RepID=A0A7U2QUB0_ASPFN|nr:hypothetical protein F9C07_1943 [Aspergillus flavus]